MQINVLEYLEHTVRRLPDKTAIIDRDVALTFRELQQQALATAGRLISKADVVSRPIAVFLPKSAQTIVADLGILYSGNCYANLDVKSPPERLVAILENLGAEIIITSADHVAA